MDEYLNFSQQICLEQFVSGLMKLYMERERTYHSDFCKNQNGELEDFVCYGYQAGWLEDFDILSKNSILNRKTAARITHQFLRIELKEADANDTSSALKLQDLYDCNRCVGHVMQIYVKGIMEGYVDYAGNYVFGMEEGISINEAQEIIERVFHTGKRKVLSSDSGEIQERKMITKEEAFSYFQSDRHTMLIDVRTNAEFQKNHLEGARNIPMAILLKNPYAVSERRDYRILLYCEEGYQSEIAANCLMDAGYEKVMYFAWK